VFERHVFGRAELGVEIYGNSSRSAGVGSTTGFNVGFRYSLTPSVRLIGSVGRSHGGDPASNALFGLKLYF